MSGITRVTKYYYLSLTAALLCGIAFASGAEGSQTGKNRSDLEAFVALTEARGNAAPQGVRYAAAEPVSMPDADPFAELAANNSDAPPLNAAAEPAEEEDIAPPPANSAPTEEQIFAEVSENNLFREIATKYPSFTDKQLFKIVGTCVMLPKHLEHCVPFSCEQLETPDLTSKRTREVIGSYEGKCYYREISKKADGKHIECELTKDEQKILSEQIKLDVSRLSKTDVLVEDAVRSAAKEIYDACLERAKNKDVGTLLAARKQPPEDDMQRIRQLYLDRAAQKGEIAGALEEYQISKEKRARLQQEILGAIREKRELPTPDGVNKDLWQMFPEKYVETDGAYADAEQDRRRRLAEYLQKLEASESTLPAELRMPKELKEAMADINDFHKEKRERESVMTPVTLQYKDFLDTDDLMQAKNESEEAPSKPEFVLKVTSSASGSDDKAITGKNEKSTQERLYEAFDALIEGQYAAAIALYKGILADRPENPDAIFGLAGAYHKLGQKKQARPYYEKGMKIAPEREDMLNNFLALLGEESPENALIELKKLEVISPDLSAVPAQIGLIYYKLKDYESAIAALKRAVALDDNNPYYLYNLAVALDKAKRGSEASYYYNKFLRTPDAGRSVASRETVQARIASLNLGQ